MNKEELLLKIAMLEKENKELKLQLKTANNYMRDNMEYFLTVTGSHTYKLLQILNKSKGIK